MTSQLNHTHRHTQKRGTYVPKFAARCDVLYCISYAMLCHITVKTPKPAKEKVAEKTSSGQKGGLMIKIRDQSQRNPKKFIKSTFHLNPLSLLPLPNLKHDLRTRKQCTTRNPQKDPTQPTPRNPQDQSLQPIQPQRKPHQIRTHHHEDIDHRPQAAEDAILRLGMRRRRGGNPFPGWKNQRGDEFGQDE